MTVPEAIQHLKDTLLPDLETRGLDTADRAKHFEAIRLLETTIEGYRECLAVGRPR